MQYKDSVRNIRNMSSKRTASKYNNTVTNETRVTTKYATVLRIRFRQLEKRNRLKVMFMFIPYSRKKYSATTVFNYFIMNHTKTLKIFINFITDLSQN